MTITEDEKKASAAVEALYNAVYSASGHIGNDDLKAADEARNALHEFIKKSPTPPPVDGELAEADFDEPSKSEVVFMGINDMRLMVDPSVPQDMILFPDEATRKWFENRCDRLIDALKCIRNHLGKMQDKNPGYDFNADPLSTTLIEGWINTALDTEEFCPDWMCQSECPASEALKEHLQAATIQQAREWAEDELLKVMTFDLQYPHEQFVETVKMQIKLLAAKNIIRLKDGGGK